MARNGHARLGGAAFLIWYGASSFLSAYRGGAVLTAETAPLEGLASVLVKTLALTWLNPHVYLDTVALIGSIAAQYDDQVRFGAGAVLASFVFFFSLGYGAHLLAPIFVRPKAWRILDVIIGTIMWAIALQLLLH